MRVFKHGNPFETDAIVNFEGISEVASWEALFEGTSIELTDGEQLNLHYTLKDSDYIYGLGENMRGMNKRGGIYESFCTDDPNHAPDRKSLYGAHNFFVLDSETFPVGIFIDFPGRVTFDFGYSHKHKMLVTIDGSDAKIYMIQGDNKQAIVKQFLKAIGPSFLPPKWAFGFQQSRWSYEDAEAVKQIAGSFEKHDLPLDTIYLDIDYMERFKNFTINQERFPDFEAFVADMKAKGIRLIPIIDAGCKIEKDYFLYEEGVDKGYYCVDEEGKPFVGAVWPGKVHFPDFINPDARKWFGDHYNDLIELGIDGFWNDMNEPAIFYSEQGLSEAIDFAASCKDKNLGIYEFFDLKDKFMGLSNSDKDYQSFYHRAGDQTYKHMDLHNLYGYNMTRAAGESFERNHPDKRLLLFSRASYIGMHRYGGIWTGDNHAWWEHLLLNIRMMPSLNMCGFIYSGADVGGFGANADAELVTRWSQFAIYTPLFRNHACMGTRSQEPFSFDKDTTDVMRHILKFRYAFVSHLYSEFMKHNQAHDMLFKPLSFVYDDQMSKEVEDQVMFGDSLMLAPVYTPNAKGRYVYLPEAMLKWQITSVEDYTLEPMAEGHHYIKIDTDQWVNFIRKNHLVVMNEAANRIEETNIERLSIIGYIESEASYELYHDDGISREPEGEMLKIKASYVGNVLVISHEGTVNCKEIAFDIVTGDGARHKGVYHV